MIRFSTQAGWQGTGSKLSILELVLTGSNWYRARRGELIRVKVAWHSGVVVVWEARGGWNGLAHRQAGRELETENIVEGGWNMNIVGRL